jgi:hypothetical protein
MARRSVIELDKAPHDLILRLHEVKSIREFHDINGVKAASAPGGGCVGPRFLSHRELR